MDNYLNAPYRDLQKLASERAQAYIGAKPFSHTSFKNFFNPEMLLPDL